VRIFTRAFTIKLPFIKRARPAGYELLEAACVEGEKGIESLFKGKTP
jgi:hypothetical protein